MNNTTQSFTDLLDECIEAVTTGRLTITDCLDQYPEHRAELAKLLPLLARLQTARQVTPSPAFRQAVRQRLLARLEPAALPPSPSLLERFQQWWQQTTAVSPRPSLAWSLALVLIVFFLFGGGTLYAANQSLPGDTLYPVNQTVENWRVELARDDQTRFELQLAFADKRLSEAARLARRGDIAHMDEALTGYQTLMQAVTQAVETADPAHQPQLANRLETATADHNVAFTRLVVATSQDAAGNLPADDELDEQRVMAIFCQPEAMPTITHPVMAKMAAEYDVPEETINNWFCQGFGIGEIGLAYNLSQQTGTAVDDFFALSQAGYGWGQIMQQSGQLLPLLPGEAQPDAVGPPDDRPTDDAGPPDDRPIGPPDDAGPPDDRPIGPPDDAGPPDGAGPPGQTDPPGQGQGPPDGAGPPGQTDPPGQGQGPPGGAGPPGQTDPPGQGQGQPDDGGRPGNPPGRGP
jgi:hypothetical protein